MPNGGTPPLPQIPRLAIVALISLPAAVLLARIARTYAPSAGDRRVLVGVLPGLMLIFAWAAVSTPWGPILLASLFLGWTLACLAFIDLIALRLPDVFTWPLTALGLAVSAILPGRPILDHVVGAAVGWSLLTAIAWAYLRLRGREGLGAGDAKLLAAGGAWLGWAALPSVILIACVVTFAAIGLGRLARRRFVLSDRIPFGAPLCLAIFFVWLQGPLAP
jgi:leader peptidase (prepilin peptidase)/N-methyltransferase